MEEIDAQRFVLPGLLTILILGAFLIIVTNGGGEEPLGPGEVVDRPARTSTTATTARTTTPEAPAPVAGASASGRFVKVQPGDTPTSIADRFAMSAERLLELNPSVDPDSLKPGQTLKLGP